MDPAGWFSSLRPGRSKNDLSIRRPKRQKKKKTKEQKKKKDYARTGAREVRGSASPADGAPAPVEEGDLHAMPGRGNRIAVLFTGYCIIRGARISWSGAPLKPKPQNPRILKPYTLHPGRRILRFSDNPHPSNRRNDQLGAPTGRRPQPASPWPHAEPTWRQTSQHPV